MFGSKRRKKREQASQEFMKQLANNPNIDKLDPEVIQMMMAGADGKISAREKKLIKKRNKWDNKTTRVGIRQEGHTNRVASRTQRTMFRAKAREVAYENGIDPRAYIANTARAVADGVVGVATAGALGSLGSQQSEPTTQPQTSSTSVDLAREQLASQLAERQQSLSNALDQVPMPRPGADATEGGPDTSPGPKQNTLLLVGAAAVALFFFIKKRK